MMPERGEQPHEAVHPRLLADGVLRCSTHRIAAVGMDHGCGVADAAVAVEKLGAVHFFRQRASELRKLRRCEIGEVAAAPWRFGDEDAKSHECRGADRPVVGPGDRVADPGIDAVESVTCGNLEVAFDRARLAAQLQ